MQDFKQEWLKAIRAALENNIDKWVKDDFTLNRIFGGANNAIYKLKTLDGKFAVKLCVEDERHRAFREYYSLRIFQEANIDIAPIPIILDESKNILPFPFVIYRWLEGTSLQNQPSSAYLNSFLQSYQKLHSIPPETISQMQRINNQGFPTAWFHWFDFGTYITEIKELYHLYSPWLADFVLKGSELKKRLKSLIHALEKMITTVRIDPRKENITLRYVRVDPNISNAIIGSDGIVRWVDWEYGGWGDPALDLSELRWHEAFQEAGENSLQFLRQNYTPPISDNGFYDRLTIWDHILAVRWPLIILRALWSNHNGPDRVRLSNVEVSSTHRYRRLHDTVLRAEIFFSIEF